MSVNIVNVSGGKDSTALLLLAIELGAENLMPVFADTGHEHPETYEYISYLENALGVKILKIKRDFSRQIERKRQTVQTKWVTDGVDLITIARALEVLHPTGNPFLDMCLWKCRFPDAINRFCTQELKTIPILEQLILPLLKDGHEITQWLGVRGDESAARADLAEAEWDDPGLWLYRPIHSWGVDEVFALHRKHNIKPNPLYSLGMGRVGCMPCIMNRKDDLAEIAARWPDEIARVREWERLVSMASKQQRATIFPVFRGHGGGIDNEVRWSMTDRGGRQFSLEKYLNAIEPTNCSSIYGLCE